MKKIFINCTNNNLWLSDVQASFVYRPENQVGSLGDVVQLRCSSSDSKSTLYWLEHPKKDTGNYIARGHQQICGPRIAQQVVSTVGNYILNLTLNALEMGMRYSCMDQTDTATYYASAEIIVVKGML